MGITFGGNPVNDHANDFWLITRAGGGDAIGYVTSPWYSLELETNIALAYVPWSMRATGTKLKVRLPDPYGADAPDNLVAAGVVDVPFRPSVNPNIREVLKSQGRDAAD